MFTKFSCLRDFATRRADHQGVRPLVYRRIDNLQNYCLGSSRGKSRLLRWLSKWLHNHLHGEMTTSGCTRAQSFLRIPKLQLSVWLSLDFSLHVVPYFDADWRPLVCFGPTNRWSKNIKSRSFRSAMPETSFALVHREPCQGGNRFALLIFTFLPTYTESSSHFPFPSHKWNRQ